MALGVLFLMLERKANMLKCMRKNKVSGRNDHHILYRVSIDDRILATYFPSADVALDSSTCV